MLQKPTLTFKDRQFVYTTPSFVRQVSLIRNSHWNKIDEQTYSTTNLSAAAAFRQCADDIAERVFSNAFVKKLTLPSRPLPSLLDPHQVEGVQWILTRSRSYLAHAPGAGKTCQAIVASNYVGGTGTVVFIVPPGLTHNWVREIEKFHCGQYWPKTSVVRKSLTQKEVDWTADYIIIPDSMLSHKWVQNALRKIHIKFLAVDEASRFKTPDSRRSIALYNGLLQRSRHVVFMDGSPMPNRPMELWAPTYALNPEAINCMEQQDFGFLYCGATRNERGQWLFNNSSNEQELRDRLQKDFMHVVGEERLSHPERLRSILFMDDVRSPEHRTWERRHLHQHDVSSDDVSQGEIATFRKELGLRKVNFIHHYVRERLTIKNESIILFCWHREVANALYELLLDFEPGLVMGGTNEASRENIFSKFQSGKSRLIIGNIQAMGRGHNLQRANRIIFGEFSWTDETNRQAEKRASRKGSINKAVRCEYICVPHSMDERVLRSVFTKQKRVERIIG